MPLDPELAAYLESQRDQPPRESLDVAATRERMRRGAALAGPPAALPKVEEVLLPGDLRGREYWPRLSPDLPLVVYFHGGRFFSGDLESHDSLCRSLALASECRILAVDYRLAPEYPFPAAFDDAVAALGWALGQQAAVGVAGDSVGANLAAGAALVHRHAGVRGQLLVYPMLDATCSLPSHIGYGTGYGPGSADMARGWREYLPAGTDPRDPRASPLFTADLTGAPPAYLLTAEYDSLRDEGERYAGRLEQAGVPLTLRRYPGTIHGFFGMAGISVAARRAVAEAGSFLHEVLTGTT